MAAFPMRDPTSLEQVIREMVDADPARIGSG
jgi:hypothetical protein